MDLKCLSNFFRAFRFNQTFTTFIFDKLPVIALHANQTGILNQCRNAEESTELHTLSR